MAELDDPLADPDAPRDASRDPPFRGGDPGDERVRAKGFAGPGRTWAYASSQA